MKADFRNPIFEQFQSDSVVDDLYEILPRFLDENELCIEGLTLKPIERKFAMEGEMFHLFIIPASIEDKTEKSRQYQQYFPGPQESLVESAIIDLAIRDKESTFDGGKKFSFSVSQLQNHLAGNNLHLNQEQIEHSIQILASVSYILVGKNTRWIFRTIETLAMSDEGAELKFLVYLGELISEQIKTVSKKIILIDDGLDLPIKLELSN